MIDRKGFSENVTVDEGVDRNGVRTQLHFEGESLIVQKTFDAEPHKAYAHDARVQTDGQRWGEGRLVGHIPPVFFGELLKVHGKEARREWIRNFFRSHPDLVMFDKYRRDLEGTK